MYLFWGHCDILPHFKNTRGRSISPILFGVGIPNLVYQCIFGWGYVAYRYGVTVTLTYDLVSTIVVSRKYLLYYLR